MYKQQNTTRNNNDCNNNRIAMLVGRLGKRDVPNVRTERHKEKHNTQHTTCLLYTSDAADE